MPLLMQFSNGVYRPVIVCDHCQRVIEDARDGNMMWQYRETGEIYCAPSFTHKACCYAFEEAHGDNWLASELSHSMVYLSNNLKMGEKEWKNAEAMARLLARL